MKNIITSISSEFGKEIQPETIEKELNLEKDFILKKTGITKFHAFENENSFFDASLKSIKQACEESNIQINQIDGIYTPNNLTEYTCPTLSSRIAQQLNLEHIISNSIGIGCSAGLQALESANNQLYSDTINNKESHYLVLGADYLTKITNPQDYKTRVLFSDAVSAMIVTNKNKKGLEIEKIATRTASGKNLYALQIKSPLHPEYNGTHWEMDGGKIFQFGLDAINWGLNLLNVTQEQIDYIIPHQPNLRMLEEIEKKYNIPPNKLYKNGIINHGNTSSSTMFIGLQDVMNTKKFKKIAGIVFGADLTYGAILCSKNY